MQIFRDARLHPMIAWFDAAVSAASSTPGRIDSAEAVQGMLVLSRVLAHEKTRDQQDVKAAALRDLKALAANGTIDARDLKTFRKAGPLFTGPSSELRGVLTSLVLGSSVPGSALADAHSLSNMVQCMMTKFQPGEEQASLREIEQALDLVTRYGAAVHGPEVVNVRDALLTMHVFVRDRVETKSGTPSAELKPLDDVIFDANRWSYHTAEGRRVARGMMKDALQHVGLALRGIDHTKITGEEAYALLKFIGDRMHGMDGDPRDGLTKLKEVAYSDCDFAKGRRELRRDLRMVETDFAAKRSFGGRLV